MRSSILVLILSFCLIAAGCHTTSTTPAPAQISESQLLESASHSNAFDNAVSALSASGYSLDASLVQAHTDAQGSILSIFTHDRTFSLLVSFDVDQNVNSVLITEFRDDDTAVVANLSTGYATLVAVQDDGQTVPIESGRTNQDATTLAAITTIHVPAVPLAAACPECQRAADDVDAAAAANNAAAAAVTAAQIAVLAACVTPALPACIAAVAALAAAVANHYATSNELVRMQGYYDDCVTEYC